MMTAVQQGCLDKKMEKYIPRYFSISLLLFLTYSVQQGQVG
jgi:hypothetical protein